ncbi:hypothetical protein PC41400_23685 [Paenibacillus chitinolyticus]|uniref:Uncharacterized protein n=1 Tax=Paenibacillus chitinolyticus TaxID=79263 RepID=A0A410X1M6_9BACL|nr:hypothetical protein PC41400_23685 [Paenibacillus chitinolyticus]
MSGEAGAGRGTQIIRRDSGGLVWARMPTGGGFRADAAHNPPRISADRKGGATRRRVDRLSGNNQ